MLNLRPLSQHVLEEMPKGRGRGFDVLYVGYDDQPKMTRRDLLTVLTNSRALVRATGTLCLKDEENQEEWGSLHATMSAARRQIRRQFLFAILESLTRADGNGSQLYAHALIGSYSLQCAVLVELMDLAGDERWKLVDRYLNGLALA
jgi:hypothetical protein